MAEFIGTPDDVQKHDEQCNYAINMIEDAPVADVAPVVHGRWIKYPRAHYFKCSECKYTVPYKKAMLVNKTRQYNYCPHCGAKMNGGDSDAAD